MDFKARHVLFRADAVGLMEWREKESVEMVYTDACNNRCCTCQYWKGERRYDARTKRVHYENSVSNLEPCAMNVKRPGSYGASGCRGFKRWVELP